MQRLIIKFQNAKRKLIHHENWAGIRRHADIKFKLHSNRNLQIYLPQTIFVYSSQFIFQLSLCNIWNISIRTAFARTHSARKTVNMVDLVFILSLISVPCQHLCNSEVKNHLDLRKCIFQLVGQRKKYEINQKLQIKQIKINHLTDHQRL
jgi:hypothetical protein